MIVKSEFRASDPDNLPTSFVRAPEPPPNGVNEVAEAQQLENNNLRPPYYTQLGAYEPFRVLRAWKLPWQLAFALKHIFRARWTKPGNTELEELRKARTYIDERIDELSHGAE